MILKRRRIFISLSILIVLSLSFSFFYENYLDSWYTFTYLLRPLWDSDIEPFEFIIHYEANVEMPINKRCQLHNWKRRDKDAMVVDAFIFSLELDLLDIRLHELYEVVDYFVIVESDFTFTGRHKDLVFQQNKERYAWAKKKIIYGFFKGRPLAKGEEPWVLEGDLRRKAAELINSIANVDNQLVIMSDVDEIPSRQSIELVKKCNIDHHQVLHLGMKHFVYSFEFEYTSYIHWRPQVHVWKLHQSIYKHGRSSNFLLTDSGWHCTFCFRNINDFIFKMTSYSHYDRVHHDYILDPERILKTVCEGSDIYEMLPEVYSFKELVLHYGNIPKSKSMVGMPYYLLENDDKYAFLLPGGCKKRERNK